MSIKSDKRGQRLSCLGCGGLVLQASAGPLNKLAPLPFLKDGAQTTRLNPAPACAGETPTPQATLTPRLDCSEINETIPLTHRCKVGAFFYSFQQKRLESLTFRERNTGGSARSLHLGMVFEAGGVPGDIVTEPPVLLAAGCSSRIR